MQPQRPNWHTEPHLAERQRVKLVDFTASRAGAAVKGGELQVHQGSLPRRGVSNTAASQGLAACTQSAHLGFPNGPVLLAHSGTASPSAYLWLEPNRAREDCSCRSPVAAAAAAPSTRNDASASSNTPCCPRRSRRSAVFICRECELRLHRGMCAVSTRHTPLSVPAAMRTGVCGLWLPTHGGAARCGAVQVEGVTDNAVTCTDHPLTQPFTHDHNVEV